MGVIESTKAVRLAWLMRAFDAGAQLSVREISERLGIEFYTARGYLLDIQGDLIHYPLVRDDEDVNEGDPTDVLYRRMEVPSD